MSEEIQKTIGELLNEIIDDPKATEKICDNAVKVKNRMIDAVNSLIDEVESGSTDIDQGLYALLDSLEFFSTITPKESKEAQ